MDYNFIITTFVSIFSIVNPLGAVANYASLTQGYTLKEKRKVIKKAVAVAFGILVAFALIGTLIFDLLDITIDGFRVAGGIVLLIISLEMVRGRTPQSKLNDKEKEDALEREQVGVVPLGIPLLAGPGAITLVMASVSEGSGGNLFSIVVVIGSTFIVCSISYLILRNSDMLLERMGRTGTRIMSRIMGLLLAAIAIQFIANGLMGLFDTWVKDIFDLNTAEMVLAWVL
ncbi:MAG: MarC family protein [Candidatus Thermoplasmatota archaeon]|nr:MarC family protein [Candidatus Thermoplasmatota archaeon]